MKMKFHTHAILGFLKKNKKFIDDGIFTEKNSSLIIIFLKTFIILIVSSDDVKKNSFNYSKVWLIFSLQQNIKIIGLFN